MSARAETKRRAFAAASAEIEATCNRHNLTLEDRFELMAELQASAAYSAPGRRPGWQSISSAILELIQNQATYRLHHMIGRQG